jgi:hypothetical protein
MQNNKVFKYLGSDTVLLEAISETVRCLNTRRIDPVRFVPATSLCYQTLHSVFPVSTGVTSDDCRAQDPHFALRYTSRSPDTYSSAHGVRVSVRSFWSYFQQIL